MSSAIARTAAQDLFGCAVMNDRFPESAAR
jgi:hypothetical protein